METTPPKRLTRREKQVMRLVCRGMTNQDIADVLVIELGTVKNHVHHIMTKLNVNNRHEARQVWVDDGEGEAAVQLPKSMTPKRVPYGWVCPQCRNVLSPYVSHCETCRSSRSEEPHDQTVVREG